MLQFRTSLIKTENNGNDKETRRKKSEVSDNRQHFENRILQFDSRLFFLPPPDQSRQFGEIHVRCGRWHGNELLLPEAATLSAGACRTISGAPTLRAMFAKSKHTRAQKAPPRRHAAKSHSHGVRGRRRVSFRPGN